MATVKESPVWLEQQRQQRESGRPVTRFSVARLFDPRLAMGHDSLVGADGDVHLLVSLDHVLVSDVAARGLSASRRCSYLIALNAGGLIGSVLLGQLSETRLGRRGAPTLG